MVDRSLTLASIERPKPLRLLAQFGTTSWQGSIMTHERLYEELTLPAHVAPLL